MYKFMFVIALVTTAECFEIVKETRFDRHTNCPVEFQERCHCGYVEVDKRRMYVTNCTNTAFDDASILQKIPKETQYLIFVGNNFTELPPNVFGSDRNGTNLEVIDLSMNGIREIKGKTFHHVDHVKRLILDHNEIQITNGNEHPRIFSNFYDLEALHLTNAFSEQIDTKYYLVSLESIFNNSQLVFLKKVHLEQNEIVSILNPRIFCQLPNIEHIYLADNRISTLQFDVQCLSRLTYLDLRNNGIQYLDQETIKQLDQLNRKNLQVDLRYNPFRCDCSLTDMFRWMQKTQVILYKNETYLCLEGYPLSNRGKRLHQLSLEDLRCPSMEESTAFTKTSNGVMTTVLALIIASLVACIVYMKRDELLVALQPGVQTTISKLRYKTLDEAPSRPENV